MRLLKLLTGGFASLHDRVIGGRRFIPRHHDDGTSTLTYGEVRRAAVAIHGPGTKVRIWHDGSGHILPPPPYREEEALYGFEHEFQLRRLLPSLGVMTLEEWYIAKGGRDMAVRAAFCRHSHKARGRSVSTKGGTPPEGAALNSSSAKPCACHHKRSVIPTIGMFVWPSPPRRPSVWKVISDRIPNSGELFVRVTIDDRAFNLDARWADRVANYLIGLAGTPQNDDAFRFRDTANRAYRMAVAHKTIIITGAAGRSGYRYIKSMPLADADMLGLAIRSKASTVPSADALGLAIKVGPVSEKKDYGFCSSPGCLEMPSTDGFCSCHLILDKLSGRSISTPRQGL